MGFCNPKVKNHWLEDLNFPISKFTYKALVIKTSVTRAKGKTYRSMARSIESPETNSYI